MRILLAEDDALLAKGILYAFNKHNFPIEWVKTGGHALTAVQNENFDLMILDLGLPGMDGIQVLKELRSEENATPILILTARDSLDERILGLDLGGDDYMTKPFDVSELVARVKALIRRSVGRVSEQLVYKELEVDLEARLVKYKNEAITLSRREYALLIELLANQGRVLTRGQLEEKLYGWDDDVESNALEVHIHHLRKKIDNSLIKTVRGIGYMVEKS